MGNEISVQSWLTNLSDEIFIAITFGKSSSVSYLEAVRIGRQADIYQEATIDGKLMHLAAFKRAALSASRAEILLGLVQGWKSTTVVAGGRIIPAAAASSTCACYAESFACKDAKAHCLRHVEIWPDHSLSFEIVLSSDHSGGKIPRAGHDAEILPCRRLSGWGHLVKDSHPSARKDQIQALAVRQSCDWCPRFKCENYRFIPRRAEGRVSPERKPSERPSRVNSKIRKPAKIPVGLIVFCFVLIAAMCSNNKGGPSNASSQKEQLRHHVKHHAHHDALPSTQ